MTNLNEIKKENKEILLKIRAKKEEIERLRVAKGALLAECRNVDSNTYKMFLQDDFLQGDKMPERGRTSLAQLSVSKSGQKDPLAEKKNIHKAECELLSELEFTAEKLHKVDFFIREMKERIRRHMAQYRCEGSLGVEMEEGE